jgi:hypothetical protein
MFIQTPIFAAVLVFLSVPLELLYGSLVFKFSALILKSESDLKKFNRNFDNINSLGFMFGPIAAPMLLDLFGSIKFLFLIDSSSYLFSAVINLFFLLRIPEEIVVSVDNSDGVKLRLSPFGMRALSIFKPHKRVFLGIFIYWVSFSSVAFTLSLLAKKVVSQNLTLYSLPVLAIYLGRILVSRMPGLLKRSDINLFRMGAAGTAFGMLALTLVNSIWLLVLIEFVLGGFIGLARIGESTFLQRILPSQILGNVGAIRQVFPMAAKLVSVPVIVLFVSLGGLHASLLALTFGFAVSAYSSTKSAFKENSPDLLINEH